PVRISSQSHHPRNIWDDGAIVGRHDSPHRTLYSPRVNGRSPKSLSCCVPCRAVSNEDGGVRNIELEPQMSPARIDRTPKSAAGLESRAIWVSIAFAALAVVTCLLTFPGMLPRLAAASSLGTIAAIRVVSPPGFLPYWASSLPPAHSRAAYAGCVVGFGAGGSSISPV